MPLVIRFIQWRTLRLLIDSFLFSNAATKGIEGGIELRKTRRMVTG